RIDVADAAGRKQRAVRREDVTARVGEPGDGARAFALREIDEIVRRASECFVVIAAEIVRTSDVAFQMFAVAGKADPTCIAADFELDADIFLGGVRKARSE